jgi:uncharacterized protein (DUF983 family)
MKARRPAVADGVRRGWRTVLKRGWRGRCPRCGEGALFRRGIAVNEFCSACRLRLQHNNGDTWMFMIITDRIPILIAIAALYFGIIGTTSSSNYIFFFAFAIPLIATIRARQGLAIALDYLFRIYVRDDDVLPPVGVPEVNGVHDAVVADGARPGENVERPA